MTPLEADYKPEGGTALRRCGLCAMYKFGGHCTLVTGPINRKGICKFFSYWRTR